MDVAQLQEMQVTVIGGARSGVAAARLLASAGARVFLTDAGAVGGEEQAELERAGVEVEQGGHTGRALEAELAVISPGVPRTIPLVRQLLQKGVDVLAEIEVASWFCRAPAIAITGSNGKTTTTSLTAHLLKKAGMKVAAGGNLGRPFADIVAEEGEPDVVVLEVSSFQLDSIRDFKPKIGVLLNITPDHLDRYDGLFTRYAASKFRIFENQDAGDVLVYSADDALVSEAVAWTASRRNIQQQRFSLYTAPPNGMFVKDDQLVFREDGTERPLMAVADLALPGRHNAYNSMAAALAALAFGAGEGAVRAGLADFGGVPHRLEMVREIDGVRYVNDSKATNVDAVRYALDSFDSQIILIAGGRDKGNDYAALQAQVQDRVRSVIAVGESADKVEKELGKLAGSSVRADSMAEAVARAREAARPGDVVLLSPACASFDQFRNYEDRGDTFKRIVNAL